MKALDKDFGIHQVVGYAAKCLRCKKLFQESDLVAMSDEDSLYLR
jgi:hypothetical protein